MSYDPTISQKQPIRPPKKRVDVNGSPVLVQCKGKACEQFTQNDTFYCDACTAKAIHADCQYCINGKFYIHTNHEDYDFLKAHPKNSYLKYCNDCLDHIDCQTCTKRSNQMLICDRCDIDGTTCYNCLEDKEDLHKDPWYCDNCEALFIQKKVMDRKDRAKIKLAESYVEKKKNKRCMKDYELQLKNVEKRWNESFHNNSERKKEIQKSYDKIRLLTSAREVPKNIDEISTTIEMLSAGIKRKIDEMERVNDLDRLSTTITSDFKKAKARYEKAKKDIEENEKLV